MPSHLKGSRIVVDGHHPVHGGASLISWLLAQGAHVTVAGATPSDETEALRHRVDEHLKRSAKDGRAYADMCNRLSWIGRRSAGRADALALFVRTWPRTVIGISGTMGKTTSVLWAAHLIGDAVAVGYAPERPYVAACSSRARVAVAEVHDAITAPGVRVLSTNDAASRIAQEPILNRIDADAFAARWGTHNVSNLVTAIGAARLTGIPASVIVRRIASLPQVPYRQEVVVRDAKITVVNDAAATTAAAGIAALARWGGPTTVLIAGGETPTDDYALWAQQLSASVRKTNVVLLAGEASRAMRAALRKYGFTVPAYGTLTGAWDAALIRARTYVSATILFSPAAADARGAAPLELGRYLNELARR